MASAMPPPAPVLQRPRLHDRISAVEQQGAATQEIARNIQEAASGTRDVRTNVAEVATAVDETGTRAGDVLTAAESLSKQSVVLETEVSRFLEKVRAA